MDWKPKNWAAWDRFISWMEHGGGKDANPSSSRDYDSEPDKHQACQFVVRLLDLNLKPPLEEVVVFMFKDL